MTTTSATWGDAAAAGAAVGGVTEPVREPGDLATVLARMRALARALPPGDGVGVFNRVYLSVTEEVDRRIATGGFVDAAGTATLAVIFANRYLAAVEPSAGSVISADPAAPASPAAVPGADTPLPALGLAGRTSPTVEMPPPPASGGHGPVPACWRVLVDSRTAPGPRPLQFALAGIAAHVGHDLALAVVDTCRRTGRPPGAVVGDYAQVGAVLTAIERRVREELMPGPDLLERCDPLTHAVGSWSLARARDGAWAAARLLWAVRDHMEAYEECAAGLDAATALVVHALLLPLPGASAGRGADEPAGSTDLAGLSGEPVLGQPERSVPPPSDDSGCPPSPPRVGQPSGSRTGAISS